MTTKISQDEMSLDRLISVLDITVKHDNITKVIVFLAMLLAQTEDSQVNIIISQRSCTGKSYILQSIADFFPSQEVMKFASASPASLIHSPSARLGYKVGNTWHYVKKGEKMPRGKYCQRVLDYAHKIIIFLDQPKPELLVRIRSFLSHDSKESNFSVVDKTKSGSMRTVENILLGFPAVFFATVEPNLDMQESTRAIILSPETSKEKNDLAVKLGVKKRVHKEDYMREIDNNPELLALKDLVKEIRASGIREVVFGEEADSFISAYFDTNDSRVIRDVEKFLNLAKAWALLNFKKREKINATTIKGTKADLEVAFKLYEPILTPNTLGIRPEIWQFYCDILKPAQYPLSPIQIQEAYVAKYKRGIGLEDIKKYLYILEDKGLVIKERSQEDARVSLYSAIKRERVDSL